MTTDSEMHNSSILSDAHRAADSTDKMTGADTDQASSNATSKYKLPIMYHFSDVISPNHFAMSVSYTGR